MGARRPVGAAGELEGRPALPRACSRRSSARQRVEQPAQQPHEARRRGDVEPLARRVRPLDLRAEARSRRCPGRLAVISAASRPPWVTRDVRAARRTARRGPRSRWRAARSPGPGASRGSGCPRSSAAPASRATAAIAFVTAGSAASFALRLSECSASVVPSVARDAERRARLDDAREVGAHAERADRERRDQVEDPRAVGRGPGVVAPRGRRPAATVDPEAGVGRRGRRRRSPRPRPRSPRARRVRRDHDRASRRAGSRCGSRRRRTTTIRSSGARAQRAGERLDRVRAAERDVAARVPAAAAARRSPAAAARRPARAARRAARPCRRRPRSRRSASRPPRCRG